MENKVKNSLRINGTTFNKLSAKATAKEDFVKLNMRVAVIFPNVDAKTKEAQLNEAYDLLTKK